MARRWLGTVSLLWSLALSPHSAAVSLPGPTTQAAVQAAQEHFEELVAEAREAYFRTARFPQRSSPERINQLQRAIILLQRALKLQPTHLETRVMLAGWLAHPELGEASIRFAKSELLKARADDTTRAYDYEISSLLALCCSHLLQFADAVGEYDRAIRMLPGEVDSPMSPLRLQHASLLGNSAESLMAIGNLDEAIRRYARAEQLDNTHHTALHSLGLAVAYDRDEQRQKATAALTRALAEDPGLRQFQGDDVFFVPEGDRFYYLGMIYAHEGAANEALDAFRQFLIATPSSQYQDRARSHIVALSKLPLLSQRELDNAVAVVGKGEIAQSGDEPSTKKHRTVADVERIGEAGARELRFCYARMLRRAPNLRGELRLGLMVDAQGAVGIVQPIQNTISAGKNIEAEDADSPEKRELTECLQRRVQRWRFGSLGIDYVERQELALSILLLTAN